MEEEPFILGPENDHHPLCDGVPKIMIAFSHQDFRQVAKYNSWWVGLERPRIVCVTTADRGTSHRIEGLTYTTREVYITDQAVRGRHFQEVYSRVMHRALNYQEQTLLS